MLTHEEHQAMIMFDRLLMAAKDNETVADLLDQTLNVARMIDPRPDDKVFYGPLQRMHFEWQRMKQRLETLEQKMESYTSNKTYGNGVYASPVTESTWPSNPGLYQPVTITTGYPLSGINTMTTAGLSWSDTIDTSVFKDNDYDYSTIKIGDIGDIDLNINNTSTKRET